MKKINLSILCLLFISYFTQAQPYVPFPDDIAIWTTSYCYFAGAEPNGGHFKTAMYGDTIIGSESYNKIYYSNDSIFNLSNAIYFAAIKEVSKKIYYVPKSSSLEYLLYDFTLSLDDTVEVYAYFHLPPETTGTPEYRTLVIGGIDSILINGIYRKRYYFPANGAYHMDEYWIEGIGSTFGLFAPFLSITDNDFHLSCYSENNQTLYDNLFYCSPDLMPPFCEDELINSTTKLNLKEDDYLIYPNPASTYLIIKSKNYNNILSNITIVNTIGQIIQSKKARNQQEIKVNIENLPCGNYYVKIYTENQFYIKKIIICNE